MPIQVRDNRGGNWFWLHNAVVDEYGARLGPYAGWIYVALCRHASTEQTAWVSHRRMAEETGVSDRKLRDELRRLEALGLIAIEQRLDDRGQQSNRYTLLDPLAQDARGVAPQATPSAPGAAPPGATDQPPWHTAPPMKKKNLTRPYEQEGGEATNTADAMRSTPAAHEAGDEDHALAAVWSSALTDLKEQIIPTNFARWLSRARLVGRDDGVVVIAVPDRVSAEQLARRFDALVRQALSDACGEPVAVRYEVAAGEG